MDDNQIRQKILELLYKQKKKMCFICTNRIFDKES